MLMVDADGIASGDHTTANARCSRRSMAWSTSRSPSATTATASGTITDSPDEWLGNQSGELPLATPPWTTTAYRQVRISLLLQTINTYSGAPPTTTPSEDRTDLPDLRHRRRRAALPPGAHDRRAARMELERMSPTTSTRLDRPRRRRRPAGRARQRGVLLGVVLVLLAVLFAAGIFALWSMRGETSSAGRDRLSRQLFDCAEQGLAWGKQYVSKTLGTTGVDQYLAANVCTTTIATPSGTQLPALPCSNNGGPFPYGATGAVTGYPNLAPFTQQVSMRTTSGAGDDFQFTVGVYNNPGDPSGYYSDGDSKVIVYSRCTDLNTLQQRAVSAIVGITATSSNDYTGQAGHGFRNQGNQNY